MGLIEAILSILAIVASGIVMAVVITVVVGICFAIALGVIGLFEDKL